MTEPLQDEAVFGPAAGTVDAQALFDADVFAHPDASKSATIGAPTWFTTPDGDDLAGRFVVMDAGSVVPSHDVNLRPNSAHEAATDLAPAERADMERRVSQIVNGLDPTKLGAADDVDMGAPVVGPDGIVEGGNARAIAIQRIQRVPGERAAAYRSWLMDNAAELGIDPAAVDATAKPMLVRMRSTPADRATVGKPLAAQKIEPTVKAAAAEFSAALREHGEVEVEGADQLHAETRDVLAFLADHYDQPETIEAVVKAAKESRHGDDTAAHAERRDAREDAPPDPGAGVQPETASGAGGSDQGDDDAAGPKVAPEWLDFGDDTGTLGVARADMPQIRSEHRGALTQFLLARGIAHEQAEVQADELRPSQREWSPAKVAKAVDYKEGDRAVLVSSDGHVVDGHHQWLAALAQEKPLRVIRFDAPIADLLTQAKEFPSSEKAQ